MTVQTFDQVAKTNNRLIRRGRRGVMLLKKYDPVIRQHVEFREER